MTAEGHSIVAQEVVEEVYSIAVVGVHSIVETEVQSILARTVAAYEHTIVAPPVAVEEEEVAKLTVAREEAEVELIRGNQQVAMRVTLGPYDVRLPLRVYEVQSPLRARKTHPRPVPR